MTSDYTKIEIKTHISNENKRPKFDDDDVAAIMSYHQTGDGKKAESEDTEYVQSSADEEDDNEKSEKET